MVSALVLLPDGFEEVEAVTIVDILRRSGVEVTIAGLVARSVEGAHGIKLLPDTSIDDTDLDGFDAVVCPGGSPGYENLRKNRKVLEIVKRAFETNKLVGAICAAPTVLSDAGVIKGKKCTIYPGMEEELKRGGGKPSRKAVVVDGNIITSRGPATAPAFALKLAERLVGRRVANEVRRKMLFSVTK